MKKSVPENSRPAFATRTPVVFWASAGLILLFVALAGVFHAEMEGVFGLTKQWIINNTSWFLILVVNGMLGFALFTLLGPYGDMRIGKPKDRPEFGTVAWLTMLFSAGMGIGLMFWSVAEPVSHFESPPIVEPGTAAAASRAMLYTYFHWGLHAWGIYAITGLALGYFSYRHGFPLTIRSAFAPLIGLKIRGRIGDLIDTAAVLATMFGVATSLGFGVMQISAGLSHIGLIADGRPIHLILIADISGVVAICVIVLFFVTSSDSGSLVIDTITSGGNPNPPVKQRIFWATLEGVVAAALLLTGGLTALQTASISTGLPFAAILVCMAYGLLKILRRDRVIDGSSKYLKRNSRETKPSSS